MFFHVSKIKKEQTMNYKKRFTILLMILSLSTISFATVYFDGEDGTVGNWHVYDNKPTGAVVSNVIDDDKHAYVIDFKGDGRLNSYMLGDKDWSNRREKKLMWSMKFSEKFKITVYLKTKKGVRTLFYDYKNRDKGLYSKRYIKIGLGSRSKNGTWEKFSRNLEADLKKYEPDNELIKVRGLKVQGSGRMDDVRLEKTQPIDACLTYEELKSKIDNNEDVTKVNISCVKDMTKLFTENINFNQDISNWDVSHVTNMDGMFYMAREFNQDISHWDVSNVTNMYSMFQDAESFNQDISKWDVSNVRNMEFMFKEAKKFKNHDLSGWDVEKVKSHQNFLTGADKNNIEPKWSKFACITRQELDIKIKNNEDVTKVNTSCIKDMSHLIDVFDPITRNGITSDFNQDISNWDVSNVTNMSEMFARAIKFNQDISKWDVSNVNDMSAMFSGARSFNQDISNWDVSNVTDMAETFTASAKFNQPIGKWDVSNVLYMDDMLSGAKIFNQPIGEWDVSNVKSMDSMFMESKKFNQDIGNWNLSNLTNMDYMFVGAESFNQDISRWNLSKVTSMIETFEFAKSFKNHDLSGWNVENVKDHEDFFKDAGENNIEPNWVK